MDLAAPRPAPLPPVLSSVMCTALLVAVACVGMPVLQHTGLAAWGMRGHWTCMQNCPKALHLELRAGGVYRHLNGERQRLGYWKYHTSGQLTVQGAASETRAFRQVFFSARRTLQVDFLPWTGRPVFCLKEDRWCYQRTAP